MNSSTNNNMVTFSDVSFTYRGRGGVQALNHLSFDLQKGNVLGIMGPNGAGKTTLCFLMSSVIPNIYGGEREGNVNVGDFDPWDQNIYETAKSVGLLLQNPETQLIMPDLSSEIMFGPSNTGAPIEEIRRRMKDSLRIVRLEGMEERHPRELSGGQKQRAALAATLAMMPDLLILDEPTSQLDPIGTTEVFDAIQRIRRERDTSIIITSHKTEEIAKVADEILIIKEGEKLAYGPPRELFKDPGLGEIGVEPPDTVEYLGLLQDQGLQVGGYDRNPVQTEGAREIIKKLLDEEKLQINPSPQKEEIKKGDPIIEMDNVTYVYEGPPPVTAIENIDLTIHEGEFVGIIGQNGSGKSTLVKNMLGLLKPTKGKVFYKGEDISQYTVAEMSKRIGLVLQNPDHQLFTISVKDEVEFGLKREKGKQEDFEERVTEALSFVGLEGKEEKFPFALSFGDRRKLTVAATVAMRPEVLIMDEPTTAQDYWGRYKLADLGQRLHDELGMTIIMITHDMDLVARYADRIIVLKEGGILLDGETHEVYQQEEELATSFLKPPQITQLALQLKGENVPGGVITPEEMAQVLSPKKEEV